jgi:hypothetical protein
MYKSDASGAVEKFAEIFGARLAGRSLELLQTPYDEMIKKLPPLPENFDSLAGKIADLEEYQGILGITRENKELTDSAEKITKDTLLKQHGVELKELDKKLDSLNEKTFEAATKTEEIKKDVTNTVGKLTSRLAVKVWEDASGFGKFLYGVANTNELRRERAIQRQQQAEIDELRKIGNAQQRQAEISGAREIN